MKTGKKIEMEETTSPSQTQKMDIIEGKIIETEKDKENNSDKYQSCLPFLCKSSPFYASSIPVSFYSKLEIAFRLAVATIISLLVESSYPWAENVTWWSVTLIIIGMKENVGETLRSMVQTWVGILYIIPFILLFHYLRFSLFFALFLLPVFIFLFVLFCSSVSDDGKRLALIVLVWNVYLPAQIEATTDTWYLFWNLVKGVFVANLVNFTIICVPLRLPNLSIRQISHILIPRLNNSMQTSLHILIYSFCNIPLTHQYEKTQVNVNTNTATERHQREISTIKGDQKTKIEEEKDYMSIDTTTFHRVTTTIDRNIKTEDKGVDRVKDKNKPKHMFIYKDKHKDQYRDQHSDRDNDEENTLLKRIQPVKNINIEDSIEVSKATITAIKALLPSAKYELYLLYLGKFILLSIIHIFYTIPRAIFLCKRQQQDEQHQQQHQSKQQQQDIQDKQRQQPIQQQKDKQLRQQQQQRQQRFACRCLLPCLSLFGIITNFKQFFSAVDDHLNSIVKYTEILADANNCLHGMLVASNDIVPNHTHEEYLKEISLPLLELLNILQNEVLALVLEFFQQGYSFGFSISTLTSFSRKASENVNRSENGKCKKWDRHMPNRGTEARKINKILNVHLHEKLKVLLEKLIQARMRVIYGIDIIKRENKRISDAREEHKHSLTIDQVSKGQSKQRSQSDAKEERNLEQKVEENVGQNVEQNAQEKLVSSTPNLAYYYSDFGQQCKSDFDKESKRIGYRNLVPRNTFILELTNLVHNLTNLSQIVVETFEHKEIQEISHNEENSNDNYYNGIKSKEMKEDNYSLAVDIEDKNRSNFDKTKSRKIALNDFEIVTVVPKPTITATRKTATTTITKETTRSTKALRSTTSKEIEEKITSNILESGSTQLQIILHCIKISFCIFLSSFVVLIPTLNEVFGPQTIWCPIAVCQTMTIVTFSNFQHITPSSSSSYKSGINRCIGTIVGAVFGFAIEQWLAYEVQHQKGYEGNVYITIMMAMWVFLCGFNKKDTHYGEIAFTAAMTSPILVLGPIGGNSGIVVRVQQIIMGTLIYVIVDNIFFPFRAKRELKKVMQMSLGSFSLVWNSSLTYFLIQQKENEHQRSKFADQNDSPDDTNDISNSENIMLENRGNDNNKNEDRGRDENERRKILEERTECIERNQKKDHEEEDREREQISEESNKETEGLLLRRKSTIQAYHAQIFGPINSDLNLLHQLHEKERKLLYLAAYEPALWHRPLNPNQWNRVISTQEKVLLHLSMLHRASVTFPRSLSFDDHNMMIQLSKAVEQLHHLTMKTLLAAYSLLTDCFGLAPAAFLCSPVSFYRHHSNNYMTIENKLHQINERNSHFYRSNATPQNNNSFDYGCNCDYQENKTGKVDERVGRYGRHDRVDGKAKIERGIGFGSDWKLGVEEKRSLLPKVEGIDIVSIRMNYMHIEELLDSLVAEYFEANQKSPVFTSVHFILPLNGLLFSAQNLGIELVDLIKYITEFEEK